MLKPGHHYGRLHLLTVGVAAVMAVGAALLVLRPAGETLIQRETLVETVSVGTVHFATIPGEELVVSEIIETRVVQVTNKSDTSDDMTETVARTAVTGWLPIEFQNVEIKFRLDRDSRTYEHDLERFMVADEIRHGYHSFPSNVDSDTVYPIWIEEFFQPYDAVYVGETKIDNVPVLEFVIDETNTAVWADTHASIARRNGDVHVTYFVEPRTGIIVDQRSDMITLSLDQSEGWLLTFEQHLKFSPETVKANIARTEALIDQDDSIITTAVRWALLAIALLLLAVTVARLYLRRSPQAYAALHSTHG